MRCQEFIGCVIEITQRKRKKKTQKRKRQEKRKNTISGESLNNNTVRIIIQASLSLYPFLWGYSHPFTASMGPTLCNISLGMKDSKTSSASHVLP